MVLAKEKSDEEAMRWLVRSVHLYPMNWGCWQEITSLIGRIDDVRSFELYNLRGLTKVAATDIITFTTKYIFVHLPPSLFTGTLPIDHCPPRTTKRSFRHFSGFAIPSHLPSVD